MLLCDEPTASLDVKSVGVVMQKLQALSEKDKGIIVVTHDQRLVPYATRVVEVQNGAAQEISQSEYLKNLTQH
jgi:putative ABC transport system ATP-binding protein